MKHSAIKKISLKVLASCLYLSLSACSQQAPRVGDSLVHLETEDGVTITQAETRRIQENGKIAGEDTTLAQLESKVKTIDYKNRLITLETTNNESATIAVGPEIRNFNQIKTGDKVKVEYIVSVSFEVRKPTESELKAAEVETVGIDARAKLGQLPAGGQAQGALSVCNIEAIDKNSGTVTLKNIISGKKAEIKAKYPENLSYAKVGDSVVITAVEALAASVERIK